MIGTNHQADATGRLQTKQPPGAEWHIWRAITTLKRTLLLETEAGRAEYGDCVALLGSVLEGWARRWAGKKEFSNFLNSKSLAHEAEEAVVPIVALLRFLMALPAGSQAQFTLVDVCAAKGYLSMLLSYLAAAEGATAALLRRHMRGIVLVEKRNMKRSHIDAANADARSSCLIGASIEKSVKALPIEVWDGCNIHEEEFLGRLLRLAEQGSIAEEQQSEAALHGTAPLEQPQPNAAAANLPEGSGTSPLLLVGVHLCGRLSSRFVEVTNALGPVLAPLAILAPCCLPGSLRGQSTVTVGQLVWSLVARERELARSAAAATAWRAGCWRCGSELHACGGCELEKGAAKQALQQRKIAARPSWAVPDGHHAASQQRQGGRNAVTIGEETDPQDAGDDANFNVSQLEPGRLTAAADPFSAWVSFLLGALRLGDVANSNSTTTTPLPFKQLCEARLAGGGCSPHAQTATTKTKKERASVLRPPIALDTTRAEGAENAILSSLMVADKLLAPAATVVGAAAGRGGGDWNRYRKTQWIIASS